jgi:tRNA pseudouridine55 synthase
VRPAFLVIDKPAGITSHDVVAAVRAVTGIKKVGHTGTLDPFATGVLPLALGPSTRLIQYLDESIKVYDATVRLGFATDTGDPTGVSIREAPVPELTRERLLEVLRSFVGERMQQPPAYSAVKVDGKPLYHYARKGEHVEAKARKVLIHDMELLDFSEDEVRVLITCSRGTYARVLADEIAIALGSAGHLSVLSRSRSGPFYLDDALSFDQLSHLVSAEDERPWQDVLLSRKGGVRVKWKPRDEVRGSLSPWLRTPVQSLPNLPLADVALPVARTIRNGGASPAPPGGAGLGGRFLVVCGDDVVALAEATSRGPKLLRVLPPFA